MPATGMPNPVGAVGELVAQLVDGLLELEDREQPLAPSRAAAGSPLDRDSLEVRVEEPLAARRCSTLGGRRRRRSRRT